MTMKHKRAFYFLYHIKYKDYLKLKEKIKFITNNTPKLPMHITRMTDPDYECLERCGQILKDP